MCDDGFEHFDFYQPTSFRFDRLSLAELMPDEPFSPNPLDDMHRRMLHFPVFFRKKVMKELDWWVVKFYQKMHYSPENYYYSYGDDDQKQALKTGIECLEELLQYLKKQYAHML